MDITGMALIGSSVISGIFAIGLFALAHSVLSKPNQIEHRSLLEDTSYKGLCKLVNNVKHINVVKVQKKKSLLNYHTRLYERLSHIEIHSKNGNISKIYPKNQYEREALSRKLYTLQSKLSFHQLPNVIKELS